MIGTIYRVICTMGCRVWDRPEVTGSMLFIFTFDSNNTSADIFGCRVNKFYQCCFKGHSLQNVLWHRQSTSLLVSVWLPPTETLCCCTSGRRRVNKKVAQPSCFCQNQSQPLTLISNQSGLLCLHCTFLLLHCWGIIVFVFALMMWLCIVFALSMWWQRN